MPAASRLVPPPARGQVLLATTSEVLREQVGHLAGLAHADVLVTGEGAQVRRAWASAPLVLVGSDMDQTLPAAPERRAGVVVLTSPSESEQPYRYAISLGATRVAVLPEDADAVVEIIGDAVEQRLVAPVVGVLGACGGVGASVLAAGLCLTAARAGLSSALVDVDALGNDLDLLVDTLDEPGLRWPDLLGARGRLPAESLGAALPRRRGVAVLAAPADADVAVPSAAMDAVVAALARGHDLVVADLPREPGPGVEAALGRCTHLLVLTRADLRGAAAARRAVARVAGQAVDVRLLVRRTSSASADPDDVAEHVGVPVLATVRHDPKVARDLPGLRLRASLRAPCRTVLAAVAP